VHIASLDASKSRCTLIEQRALQSSLNARLEFDGRENDRRYNHSSNVIKIFYNKNFIAIYTVVLLIISLIS